MKARIYVAMFALSVFFSCNTCTEVARNNSNNTNNSNNATNNTNNSNNTNNQTTGFEGSAWSEVDRPFTRTLGADARSVSIAHFRRGTNRIALGWVAQDGTVEIQEARLERGNLVYGPLIDDENFFGNDVALRTITNPQNEDVVAALVTAPAPGPVILWGLWDQTSFTTVLAETDPNTRTIGAAISGSTEASANWWHLAEGLIVSGRSNDRSWGVDGFMNTPVATLSEGPVYVRDTSYELGLFTDASGEIWLWDTEQFGVIRTGLDPTPTFQLPAAFEDDRESNHPQLVGLGSDEYLYLATVENVFQSYEFSFLTDVVTPISTSDLEFGSAEILVADAESFSGLGTEVVLATVRPGKVDLRLLNSSVDGWFISKCAEIDIVSTEASDVSLTVFDFGGLPIAVVAIANSGSGEVAASPVNGSCP